MLGEGSPGLWFFARNSGKNLREKEPSGSLPTSCGRPLRLLTSLDLLAEARAKRKAVLRERSFREAFFKGSYGACLREVRTKNRSQAGCLRGDLASKMEAPLRVSLRRGSSEKEGRPSCRSVVLMAALCTRIVETDLPWDEREPRKLAKSTLEARKGEMPCSSHQLAHLDQWEL